MITYIIGLVSCDYWVDYSFHQSWGHGICHWTPRRGLGASDVFVALLSGETWIDLGHWHYNCDLSILGCHECDKPHDKSYAFICEIIIKEYHRL